MWLLADAQMLPGWDAASRGHWPNFGGTLDRVASCRGARPQAKAHLVGEFALMERFGTYRLWLLLQCGVRWQTHRTARLRSLPTLGCVEPDYQDAAADLFRQLGYQADGAGSYFVVGGLAIGAVAIYWIKSGQARA